jgi:PAS domain S-box-containing protein
LKLTRLQVLAAVVALAGLLLAASGYLIRDRQRDSRDWESRLGAAADARSQAVSATLASDLRDLSELAGNVSLQMYFAQLVRTGAGTADETALAQKGYLRNLLVAAADRGGYTTESSRLPANLTPTQPGGLALLDPTLTAVLATPGMRDLEPAYQEIARRALADSRGEVTDLALDRRERPVLVQAVAVRPALGTAATGRVGVLVGVRGAAQSIYPLLANGLTDASTAMLVARRGESITYLSPGSIGAAPLKLALPVGRSDYGEVAAVLKPGGFARARTYRGEHVLQVSRRVSGTDWVLLQQIDAGAALAGASEREALWIVAGALLVALMSALAAILTWRRQAVGAELLAARMRARAELLHAVTDNIDVLAFLVSREGEVLFGNRATADAVGIAARDIAGKHLSNVFDATTLSRLLHGINAASSASAPVHEPLDVGLGDARRNFQASFIPIDRHGERTTLTLVVLTDVSELKRAQERHAEMLEKLVATLVQAVDLHDPYAAQHARRMTEVADAVARTLDLSEQERTTLDIAATLANIGKIMVPAELLTKTEPLTDADWQTLRRHVDFSVDLLKSLDFEGPVRSIIAQKQEHLDGTGYPRGLKAEQMTLSGRILAVANAFVAMVSDRAYRHGVSIEQALQELMEESGTHYDRGVVAALFHVAENRKDWSDWERERGETADV